MKMYLNRLTAKVTAIAPAAIQWGTTGFTETAKRLGGMLQSSRQKAELSYGQIIKAIFVDVGHVHIIDYIVSKQFT